MTELEALRRLCDGQRQLARLRRSQHSAALQALADYLRQGRCYAATSLPKLADLYEDAQRRFFEKGELRCAKMLSDIPAEYRARGLDPQEFLSDSYTQQVIDESTPGSEDTDDQPEP